MKTQIGIVGAALVMAMTLTACAQKTASEQLQDDLKKAQKEMQREADAWK